MLPQLLVTDFAGTKMNDDGAVFSAYRGDLTEFNIASRVAVGMAGVRSGAHGIEFWTVG